jgi:branched-chain amino acid transport system ATP-binding protein
MGFLDLSNVHVHYGAIEAVKGIDLRVDQGEVVTLIGGNGAGKTTTLRAISGIQRITSGSITFRGKRIDVLPAHRIVAMGIGHAPQGRLIFGGMTVRENLELGAYQRTDRTAAHHDMDRVLGLFPPLKERVGQRGGTLSGGEQQMLAIGRAMMTSPDILMLDEPSLGLAPMLVERIFDIVREINEQGTTILLIEQNAHMALAVADRGYVMESGNIVLEDSGQALLGNDQVRGAYLGVS